MSSHAITFPRPPPTCNTLSSQERLKLLKSTAKLGSVLGSVPHVIDETFDLPSHVVHNPNTASRKTRQRLWSFKSRKASSDTSGSDSDVPPAPRNSLSSSRTESSTMSSSASSVVESSESAWRARLPEKRPPLLRLGVSKKLVQSARRLAIAQPTLESIPGSPPPPSQSPPSSPSSSSYTDIIDLYATYEKDDPFGAYADSSYIELNPTVPIPAFTIPSDAALRREKMRRLKRKLGEHIPVHLVFPPIAESDEEDVWIHSPTTPTSPESGHTRRGSGSSCDSSSALLTDSEREDVVPPLPNHLPFHAQRSRIRHEARHQAPRRSSFARNAEKKPLPALPPVSPLPTTRTVKRRSGQFIIHYECTSEHGVDAFDGLKCVGGVDSRIWYAI